MTLLELDNLEQQIILAASSKTWLPAYLLTPSGQPGFTAAGFIRRHPELFEGKMGGAQAKVYRLTAKGQEVAASLRARAAQEEGR